MKPLWSGLSTLCRGTDFWLALILRVLVDHNRYLFDREFDTKCPQLAADYDVPALFGAGRDLFALLGGSEWRTACFGVLYFCSCGVCIMLCHTLCSCVVLMPCAMVYPHLIAGNRRPHWRWLIIGGVRSGSSFHIDPNATSARGREGRDG